ncbi:MAG TPA: cytochrome c [Thermoanaerobaculia bacterium]|nr:cytochrome c [Thermoanaerobaculia bacterium]
MSALRRVAALVAAAALAGCSAEGDRPGTVFLPDMVDSGVVHAYDRSAVTRNGGALLLPPAGTVPVERTPFAYGPGPAEARRAGVELVNPFTASPEALARGKQVYDTICTVCHGAKGEGDGPIIGRFPNPPSLLAAHARTLPDGQIVHIVTRGQGIMPAHAAQVLLEDRWRVALYLRQLQGAPEARP